MLDDGDMTLFTAPSGAGKSTAAAVIAEFNAYVAEACDVLCIHLETNHSKLQARSYARNLHIPLHLTRSKAFNPDDPRFAKDIQRYTEMVKSKKTKI